ncbi:hypothetical protein HELRODRAFT_113490 [Helobdella robusta]|uniref:Transcription factor n=1 Tax=Helobdella robusta TaxID=6412 RepID=T1EFS8_HELRO|nr:hypothetical protein HELRODRAFT_113490 [Helobdella robusta]ESO00116.1 hypothetical protein HELRODRAFT_113490 [Helobdella robusta]
MNTEDIKPNIWLDLQNNVITAAGQASTPTTCNAELTNFYSDIGLETMARDAGVIEVEVATQAEVPQTQLPQQKNKTYKIIAVQVPSKNQGQTYQVTHANHPMPQILLAPAHLQQPHIEIKSEPISTYPPQQHHHQLQHQLHHHQQQQFQIISPRTATTTTATNSWLLHNAASANNKRRNLNDSVESFLPESGRRRKGSNSGKGLRHFSMKVCEKVQRKQITSYNEVADELVSEISDETGEGEISQMDQSFDQKNIRRRVYDALNVLMAMNIISKEKKEIKWIGLPTNTDQEYQMLEQQEMEIMKRVQDKKKQLSELIIQQVAFKNLVERNRQLEEKNEAPPPNSTIQLPFILVTTSKDTVIECNISSDKSEYSFKFDRVFSIHDDIDVLKAMGMAFNLDKGHCLKEDFEKVLKMIPNALHPFVYEMANRKNYIKVEPESTPQSGAAKNSSNVGSKKIIESTVYTEYTSESLDNLSWPVTYGTGTDVSSCASRSDQPSPICSDSD